jgi:hypothetical protein
MQPLREQLATRLAAAFLLGNGGKERHVVDMLALDRMVEFTLPPAANTFPLQESASFLPVADECLRQMRWAWHAARWSNPETMSWSATILEDGDMDCGLAPEKWKDQ